MSFRAAVFNVIIASPSDLAEERKAAREAIHEWNDLHAEAEGVVLLPMGWESHAVPQTGRPQAIINKQLVDKSDLLIGIFWTKLGTDTGIAESGTVEEINQIVTAGKPAMLYFSKRPVEPDKIDLKQMRKLKAFKSQTYEKALTGTFKSPDEFRQTLMRDLTRRVRLMAEEAPVDQDAEQREEISSDGGAATKIMGFYARFNAGEFYGLNPPGIPFAVIDMNKPSIPEPRQAFTLLSIVPMKQPPQSLDIAAIDQARPEQFRPLAAEMTSGWTYEGYGRRFVTRDLPREGAAQLAVTELNDDGSIHSGVRMVVWPKRLNDRDVVNLEIYERHALHYLAGYVKLLRSLSVTGKLHVRFILHGLDDAYISALSSDDGDQSRRIRPIRDGTTETSVTLPANISGESVPDVAAEMRSSMLVIWRDAGYTGDPCFDASNNFISDPPR